MNAQEHALMVTVMAKHFQHVKIILDVLKSRGVLTDDDVQAFSFAGQTDTESNAALAQDALKEYQMIAKRFGLETGLEGKLQEIENDQR